MTAEQYIDNFKEYPKPIAQQQWVLDYQMMIVHTRGEIPTAIIQTTRPNEAQDVRDYRLGIYEPITRDPFNKAITNLQRTLSHSSVEIIYPEKTKTYLQGSNFRKMNFLSFLQKFVVKRMIEAANALLVWWPESEVLDEDGRIADSTQQVRVVPIIVMPEDIVHYDSDVLTWLSKEVNIFNAGDSVIEGEVYYTIHRDGLWKRKQVATSEPNMWEWTAYYTNPFNEVYALPLGGDEVSKVYAKEDEEVTYFTSYFSSAVPFANEAIRRFSDTQGVWTQCASPIREVEDMPCTAQGCKNGKVDILSHVGKFVRTQSCGQCGGTGKILPTTSYGYFVRPSVGSKTFGQDGQPAINKKAIEYLHPSVDILKFGEESVDNYIKKTENALNLIFTDMAQSGVAKDIDREDKLSMLDKIAAHVYRYLAVESCNIIHKFLFPNNEIDPVQINLPVTFVIKSEGDIINELAALRSSNAPDNIIAEVQREFMYKRYGGDPQRMKFLDAQMMIDPLAAKTPNEKRQDLNSNAISEADYQFSVWTYPMLLRYSSETNGFVDMEMSKIVSDVTAMIEAKVDELAAKSIEREKTLTQFGANRF